MTESSNRAAVKAAARSLYANKITADVVEQLDRANVPAVLLKGPAIGDLIGDSARNYVDTDILVPIQQFEEAESVLEAMDFTLVALDAFKHDWIRHAHTWVRRDGAVVDLHRTLIGAGVDPGEVWRLLDGETTVRSTGGRSIRVLNDPARTLVLTLHAAKDGVRVGRPLRDLAAAVERVPPATWKAAVGIAERLEALPAFAAGLRLLPEGRELADRLSLPRLATTAILLRTHGAPQLSMGVDWFFRQPSLRTKLALAARKVFPPRNFMLAWSALARRGTLGLAFAYVWRPLWLLARIGPALIAHRRARRSAANLAAQESLSGADPADTEALS